MTFDRLKLVQFFDNLKLVWIHSLIALKNAANAIINNRSEYLQDINDKIKKCCYRARR